MDQQQPETQITQPSINPPTESIATPVASETPTTSQPPTSVTPNSSNEKRKKLMLIAGITMVSLFLIGSIMYAMGIMNRTKRLGASQTPSVNSIQQPKKPAPTTTESVEEVEAINVDTGDPEKELIELETEASSL